MDATQAAGWLPFDADAYDYIVTVAFKWLARARAEPRTCLVVPEDLGGLTPLFAGWVARQEPWDSCYGPVEELARSARRFDESPSLFLATRAPRRSLALVEEIGVSAVHAHDPRWPTASARVSAPRPRAGPAPGSAIVVGARTRPTGRRN